MINQPSEIINTQVPQASALRRHTEANEYGDDSPRGRLAVMFETKRDNSLVTSLDKSQNAGSRYSFSAAPKNIDVPVKI